MKAVLYFTTIIGLIGGLIVWFVSEPWSFGTLTALIIWLFTAYWVLKAKDVLEPTKKKVKK